MKIRSEKLGLEIKFLPHSINKKELEGAPHILKEFLEQEGTGHVHLFMRYEGMLIVSSMITGPDAERLIEVLERIESKKMVEALTKGEKP